MKKRFCHWLLQLAYGSGAFAPDDFDASKGEGVETKIGLITMDQMDVHWVRLKKPPKTR